MAQAAAAPAASAEAPSFRRLLKQAAGDVSRIMQLVVEAEQSVLDNHRLCKVYEVAMNAFGGSPLEVAAEEYGELCVRRLQLLCAADPPQARVFLDFMAHYSIRQQDVRLRRAAAQLREPASRRPAAYGPDAPGAPVRASAVANRLSNEGGRKSITTPLRPRALSYSGALAPCPEEDEALPDKLDGFCLEERAASEQAAVPAGWLDRRSILSERSHAADLSPIPEACGDSPAADASSNRSSNAERSPARLAEATPPAASTRCGDRLLAESEQSSAPCSREAAAAAASTAAEGQADKVFVVNGHPYRRVQKIGHGGSSKVYQVQGRSGEMHALKRVSVDSRDQFEALANEVTMLQQFQDCPHVIRIIDAELFPEQFAISIVMELGEVDLGKMLQSDTDISLGDILDWWKQLLEVVQAIHDRRVVHSDIKPANFLMVNGRLKVIDFGIAERIRGDTTHINRDANMGTVSYMSPETVQQGKHKVSRSADIWSLGVILYQMLYGRTPFAHMEPLQRIIALTDPSCNVEFPADHFLEGHSEAVATSLLDVLRRCLQRDPKLRPTIPQLLDHAFLPQTVQEVSRRTFDYAVEALVQAFCHTARDAILNPNGDAVREDETEEDGRWQDPATWQALADDIWERLAQRDPRRPSDYTELPGLAQFRACVQGWHSRGAKRQRVAEGAAPPGHAAPAEPQANVRRLQQVAQVALSGRRAVPSAMAAAAATAATVSQRAQFRPAGSSTPSGASSIRADQLQTQRDRLKKGGVQGAPAAEVRPQQGVPGQSAEQQESIVLKRLKDRRAAVANPEEHTEEMTHVTRWGLFGA